LKAENILIDFSGHVRLGGFRQIRQLQSAGQIQKSIFSLVGDNLEWAAPEVIVQVTKDFTQNSNYTISADIYSLGITALELMFNQTPYSQWPPPKILLCKLKYDCPCVKSDKEATKAFYRFVQMCVKKNPKERPDIQGCYESPFLKLARGNKYLERLIVDGEELESDNVNSSQPPEIDSREFLHDTQFSL
jgi:serine/threonine-protein kinase 24/25/MST4